MAWHGRLGLALVLVVAGMTGCIGTDGETPEDQALEATNGTPDDGANKEDAASTGGNATIGPDAVIEGPDWQVGQWFGYHVFFGPEDDEGIHYEAAVIEDTGTSWYLAAADPFLSKLDVMEDLPFVGTFSQQDLSTTAGREPFEWYDWPLFDGKNDTREEVGLDGETYEVTYSVSYEAAISTKAGDRPGFSIVGETSQGETVVTYDYVPAIGWFGHLFMYPLDGQTGDDWSLHIMTMGSGEAFDGTVYVDEGEQLVDHFNGVAPPSFAEPNPHSSFTVSDQATHMVGFAWSSAVTGAHATSLVAPNGTAYPLPVVAPPLSSSFASQFLIQPAQAGQWELVTAGAGQWAGGGASIWETVETTYELADGAVVEGS